MTTIYFVRHAEADNTNRDGRNRPLTAKGLADRRLVTEFLQDKKIDAVLSSPFKRAVDTISEYADINSFEIELIEEFREQRSSSDMRKDNPHFSQVMIDQWLDTSYTYSDGESIAEVQERNIAALNDVLIRYKDKTVVIGTHATALTTIINNFDKTYGYDGFMAMVDILPWVAKMNFNEKDCIKIEMINLFD